MIKQFDPTNPAKTREGSHWLDESGGLKCKCVCGKIPQLKNYEDSEDEKGSYYLICNNGHRGYGLDLLCTANFTTITETIDAWNLIISQLSNDPINHPKHYQSEIKCKCGESLECIDFVRHCGYREGNIIKYVWRYKEKGGIEDLKKAQWYLNDLITSEQKK